MNDFQETLITISMNLFLNYFSLFLFLLTDFCITLLDIIVDLSCAYSITSTFCVGKLQMGIYNVALLS